MKRIIDTVAVTIFSLAMLGLGAVVIEGCAGWGKTTCQVVDATENACGVIRFMGSDGGVQSVPLSAEEMQEMGRTMAAKKAAKKPDAK